MVCSDWLKAVQTVTRSGVSHYEKTIINTVCVCVLGVYTCQLIK